MKRVVAILAVCLLVVSPIVGLAVAQDGNQTTTQSSANDSATTQTNWSPPGPFTREELTKAGAHDPDAQDSIRLLGDPVRGGMGVRYKPAKPLEDEWTWLKPGSTVKTNRMQIKSTAFADATGEYTLVITYWEPATKKIQTQDGVVRRQYAANQTVQRVTLNLENGYTTQWIELRSVFDGTKRVSMWLERDGEVVEGARWEFRHETNPLAQAPASPITSKGDLWEWAAITIFAPVIPGILLGRYAAQHVLSRTVVGTQRGVGFWLGALTAFLMVGLTAAWWQLSVIAAYLPMVAGLFITGIAFIGYLGFRDDDVERAEFNQKDLTSTTSVTSAETKTARNEEILLRNIVRRDGKIFMPAKGIRPLLARYWASPAEVDESDLKTVNDTSGDVSKKYEIDPDADTTLRHTPAHLSFDPQLTRDLDDEELDPLNEQAAEYAEMDSAVGTVMAFPVAIKKMLLQINWRFVSIAFGGFLVSYLAVKATLGLPMVGAALGLLPLAIAGTKAKDGSLEFTPAPYHWSNARAILVHERKTYKEAKTFQQLEESLADMDMDSISRALSIVDSHRSKYRERLSDLAGESQPASGGGQTAAASMPDTPDLNATAEVSDDD